MSLLVDYIVSLTNLYGIVHKEKVVEVYNQQNDRQIDVREVETIMEKDPKELRDQFSINYGDYFVHESIVNFDEFDLEMQKKQGKPYFIPPKDELLKYKDEFYFEKTKEYKALLRYVTKHFYKKNKYAAEELCEDIQFGLQSEFEISSIINEFNRRNLQFEDENQVGEVLDLIMNLSNNTRLWANNGFTPNELFEKHEKLPLRKLPQSEEASSAKSKLSVIPGGAVKKVGRNEPCPCGSGKKYKKCCLGQE